VLRDKNLVPLSHQHQHALALCVRIDRASPIDDADLHAWQSEVLQLWRNEITIHFAAEERIVFPAARGFKELAALVNDLIADHVELRAHLARAEAQRLSSAELCDFAQKLSNHIRKEERQLFEMLQQLLSKEQLNQLGKKLDIALKDVTSACALPSASTRLQTTEKTPRK
jgi:iron-sulfur cluster repair protein YtfE (RIC family)